MVHDQILGTFILQDEQYITLVDQMQSYMMLSVITQKGHSL